MHTHIYIYMDIKAGTHIYVYMYRPIDIYIYISEVGGEHGSEAGVPNRESKPSAHAPAPHARHDRSMARSSFSG